VSGVRKVTPSVTALGSISIRMDAYQQSCRIDLLDNSSQFPTQAFSLAYDDYHQLANIEQR